MTEFQYPWTEMGWHQYLNETWLHSRSLPGWKLLFGCHDQEDHDYWNRLDGLKAKGFLKG